jgi:hypothetical protein
LLPQSLTILYIFCSDLSANLIPPTPIRLVKTLIGQLLALHPHVPYGDPMFYSVQRFQHAATFNQVWQIFENLVQSIPDVFLVIDRIEECVADDQSSLTSHFLPSLMKLLSEVPGARAIVTSIYEPPEELLDIDTEGILESVFIDTAGKRKAR